MKSAVFSKKVSGKKTSVLESELKSKLKPELKSNDVPTNLRADKQDSREKNLESNPAREIGGRKEGLDPTRYGDWEKNGRCIDF